MNEIFDVIQREFIYLQYYFLLQLRQIAGYWILGMVMGSLVSVFAKDVIHGAFDRIRDKKWGIWGVIPASLLGVASPLCMYGTIPIAASFSRHGMRDDWLAALLELLPAPDGFIDELNALGIPGVQFKKEPSVKCGITGTHMTVAVNGEEEESHDHHYGGMQDIEHIVREHLSLPEKVQNDVMAVYGLIADGAAGIMGKPIVFSHGIHYTKNG